MATKKPAYSYHAQLLLLTKAMAALREARTLLDQAFDSECAQLGPEEASDGEYGELARLADDVCSRTEDHAQAVKALAEMCPPDMVTPRDPTDYSEDPRLQRMANDAFDMAQAYGVDATEVCGALLTSVKEGDQR